MFVYAGGSLTFLIYWVQEAAVVWGPFPILVYLIMRCVCLIVYLESRTSFIDLVPDRPPQPPTLHVLSWCSFALDMLCQVITVVYHIQFP